MSCSFAYIRRLGREKHAHPETAALMRPLVLMGDVPGESGSRLNPLLSLS